MAEEVSHPGLAGYLQEHGYEVINLSVGGSCNRDAVYRLSGAIQSNDIVIWIKTDPLRDLRPYNNLVDQVLDSGGIINLSRRLSNQCYQTANAIANMHGTTIYCIGGFCDLDLELLEYHPQLTALVPSWVQMLVNTQPDNFFHGASDWSMLLVDADYDYEFKQKIINELYSIVENEQVFDNEIFRPDGKHPNRVGHRYLADHIINQLQL
jgi:hypothetical protein